jgi:hypothetical protein
MGSGGSSATWLLLVIGICLREAPLPLHCGILALRTPWHIGEVRGLFILIC